MGDPPVGRRDQLQFLVFYIQLAFYVASAIFFTNSWYVIYPGDIFYIISWCPISHIDISHQHSISTADVLYHLSVTSRYSISSSLSPAVILCHTLVIQYHTYVFLFHQPIFYIMIHQLILCIHITRWHSISPAADIFKWHVDILYHQLIFYTPRRYYIITAVLQYINNTNNTSIFSTRWHSIPTADIPYHTLIFHIYIQYPQPMIYITRHQPVFYITSTISPDVIRAKRISNWYIPKKNMCVWLKIVCVFD